MYDSDKQTDLRSKAKHTEVRVAAMRGHSLGSRTSVKGRARGAFEKHVEAQLLMALNSRL